MQPAGRSRLTANSPWELTEQFTYLRRTFCKEAWGLSRMQSSPYFCFSADNSVGWFMASPVGVIGWAYPINFTTLLYRSIYLISIQSVRRDMLINARLCIFFEWQVGCFDRRDPARLSRWGGYTADAYKDYCHELSVHVTRNTIVARRTGHRKT